MTMATAAVLHERGTAFKLACIELGDLAPDEVLLRNEACGICHTDLIAQHMVPLPAVFGHEGCGVVEAVGSKVQGVRPGDRVISSYPFCAACSGCLAGKPYHCVHHMRLGFGGRRLDGSFTMSEAGRPLSGAFFQQSSFASHAIVPAHNVVRVDRETPAERLAAIPCGVQTGAGAILYSLDVKAGEALAVFGCGTVGLSAIMAAKLAGAYPIVAIDIKPTRLALAMALGATHVVDATLGETARRVLEVCPSGVHKSLETSGHEAALDDAVDVLATAGVCGMVIAPHMGEKYPFDTSRIFKKAATLTGVIQGSAVPRLFLPRLLQWQRAGVFPIERMVRTYAFEDINRAVMDMQEGAVVKAVLTFD